MRLSYSESALVIVGGFNYSVIRPSWLDKHLIKPADPDSQDIEEVSINIRVSSESSINDSPIVISFNGISITFLNNRLEFRLVETDDFSILEKYSLRMCDSMPNIPTASYGMYFVFRDINICESVMDIKNAARLKNCDVPLTLERYNLGFKLDNIDTTITIDINNSDNSYSFIVNFDFSIDSLIEFKSQISETPIQFLKEKAIKILLDMYGVETED